MPRTGFRAWVDALRLEYQGDNLVAWFTVSALALASGAPFEPGWFVLGLAMLISAQCAVELLDGYHDFQQGAHAPKAPGQQVWTGGSGALADGRLAPEAVHRAAWIVGGGAMVLLAATLVRTGAAGLAVGAITVVCSIGWAKPPLKLSYRGLGELTVAIVAGPLLAEQAWLIATGTFSVRALWVGVPFGLLELSMALMHGISDRVKDAEVGKRTLIVRIGDRRAAIAHALALVAAFAALVVLVARGLLPTAGLLALAAVPLAVRSARMALAAARDRRTLDDSMRAFPAYAIHALVGVILVVACTAALPAAQALTLLGAFAVCYAPVAAVILRRLLPVRGLPAAPPHG